MKTTKPISTISYNSEGFLISVLERLEKECFLQFWVFLKHDPEEDEEKEHLHVYLEPNKAIDTAWLRKQFLQVVNPNEPPLGCLPFRASKFVDWYWYGLHDVAYLMSKGQSRKYHYTPADMITDDVEYLRELERENPNPKAEILQVMEMSMQGKSPLEIAVARNIPLVKLAGWLAGFQDMKLLATGKFLERNGLPNHEPKNETIFGEIEGDKK